MAVLSAAKDIERIKASAEQMHAAKPERIGSPSLGDVVRQGDLYLVCIERAAGDETRQKQLAPGTTQGSRHVIVGDCVVRLSNPLSDIHEALRGPSFDCRGECTIEHPEHGHKILPAGTSWAVVYQRVHADEVRRVRD